MIGWQTPPPCGSGEGRRPWGGARSAGRENASTRRVSITFRVGERASDFLHFGWLFTVTLFDFHVPIHALSDRLGIRSHRCSGDIFLRFFVLFSCLLILPFTTLVSGIRNTNSRRTILLSNRDRRSRETPPPELYPSLLASGTARAIFFTSDGFSR